MNPRELASLGARFCVVLQEMGIAPYGAISTFLAPETLEKTRRSVEVVPPCPHCRMLFCMCPQAA